MKLIPFIKTKNCFLFCILFLCFCGTLKAQPGWKDFTSYYYYDIFDTEGNLILFKKNSAYRIRVNNILYSNDSIPSDSLKPIIKSSTRRFDNYIRVNDLSLRIPQREWARNVEIEIIFQNDTVHLNQKTGNATQPLQFIPGHYYFPIWAREILAIKGTVSQKVIFVNASQKHFSITRELYLNSYRNELLQNAAEEQVVNNFIKDHLDVDKKVEDTKFNKSFVPYRDPIWEGNFYPSEEKDLFFGLVEYKLDTHNVYSVKGVFSTLDKGKNTITHWSPKEDLNLFYSVRPYVDSFNNIIYLPTGIREKFGYPCNYRNEEACPHTIRFYMSKNYGSTWTEDKKMLELSKKFPFRYFEFINKNYALSFNLTSFYPTNKLYQIQRGTYYLLKNMKVIDSLKTPDDVHYNGNYNKYSFSRTGDTIRLGAWSKGFNDYSLPYYVPFLIKNKNLWRFQVVTDSINRYPPPVKKDTLKEYQNFKLVNRRELVFKNGAGILYLKTDVGEEFGELGYVILEKGSKIYLLNQRDGYTLVSFDAGTSWYVYPKALSTDYDFTFLEIDDQNVISFFNKRTIGYRNKMHKVFYTFSPK